MENVFFTSEPMILLLITFITVALIILGRKLELPVLPVIVVIYSLGLLIYHTVGLNFKPENVAPYYFSIAADLIMLFLGFITYLWVDDIVAKNKNLKSYGDILSWFWDKL